MAKLIQKPRKEGQYLAHGNDGKTYAATKVNKYIPGGVMFFCIPAGVKILGYERVSKQDEKPRAPKPKSKK